MKQFFKIVFASMIGFGVTLFLGIMIIIGVVAAMSGGDKDEKNLEVKENSVLHLDFSGGLVDRGSDNPFETFDFNTMQSNKKLSLKEVLDNLKKAKADDKIEGAFLDLKGVSMNMANLDEVREGLEDFKTSGKWIVAYGQDISQGTYYLASVADQIYVYPEGGVEFNGLMSEIMFFKGMLEKLEVEVQIIRGKNNKFKSAVEPFMYDKMSDPNREQLNKLLSTIWENWTEKISESRGITVASLNEYADSLRAFDPSNAIAYKLVDGLLFGDQVLDTLRAKLDVKTNDDINFVSLSKYTRAPEKFEDGAPKPWELKDKIAIIYGAGEIRSGKSDQQTMGSKTIVKAIRAAREDSSIKAIVFRVNSPGGSALASDVMWRETQLAKAAKPFVISMGGLAASGGYYVSAGADRVFAGANTITGSIGVFGMIPNAKNMLNNKLGLTFDGVQTNANSDIGMLTQPLTPFQYGKIQQSVEKVYDTFLGHVSEGRNMTKEEVDAIGQGRVWTGEDALELGLVDELGGLNDAIAYAAEQAGLANYRLKSFPEKKDAFQELIKEITGESSNLFLRWKLGDFYSYYQTVDRLTNSERIQARIPYDIQIR
ncbi:signal peptide peptidase SppA [Salibacteraceae bacterium]|nr:signal peptide peptidase SppA [Bacteroidota bacterium]MDC1204305.1 signal peptide peptidase SppA [Salibacteraceae bacterium]